MATLKSLEKRIILLEQRNRRVEADKAWETSLARRGLIISFTYFSIALYLRFIVGINPWINAIVPSLGFLLSTLTLPYFKQRWINQRYSQKQKFTRSAVSKV